MQYYQIPGLDRPVSRFIFGTAIASMSAGEDAGALLDAVFAAGINTFDTALLYGVDDVPVEQGAAIMNTISYELLCVLAKRIPRVYIDD